MRTWITLAVCALTIATAPLDAFAYWVDNWVDEPVYGYVPESYTYQVDVPDYSWVDQGAPTVATQTQDTVVGTVSPPAGQPGASKVGNSLFKSDRTSGPVSLGGTMNRTVVGADKAPASNASRGSGKPGGAIRKGPNKP